MSKKHEQIYQFVCLTADMLGEKNYNAKIQIHQICKKAGTAKVVELLKEVLAIEENGGMMTSDGAQRRSPGGVFFHLAKLHGYQKTYSPEQKRLFWAKRRAKHRAKKQVEQDRTAVHKNDESLTSEVPKSA